MARELPPRLLENYKLNYENQQEAPDEMTGYRHGDLQTVLDVFRTPAGAVFVDNAGGGKAWAESCDAMDLFIQQNSWDGSYACLDGQTES